MTIPKIGKALIVGFIGGASILGGICMSIYAANSSILISNPSPELIRVYDLQNTENHLRERRLELLCEDSIKLDGGECRTLEREIDILKDYNRRLLAEESVREELAYNEINREYMIELGAVMLLGGILSPALMFSLHSDTR